MTRSPRTSPQTAGCLYVAALAFLLLTGVPRLGDDDGEDRRGQEEDTRHDEHHDEGEDGKHEKEKHGKKKHGEEKHEKKKHGKKEHEKEEHEKEGEREDEDTRDEARTPPPDGAWTGLVLDEFGDAVAGAEVASFDLDTDTLLEVVSTDAWGRFGLAQLPPNRALFVSPPFSTGLVGTWLEGQGPAPSYVTIRLRTGRPLTVRVVDPSGAPVSGARVRAIEPALAPSGGALVVALVRTGPDGVARFHVPPWVHVEAAVEGRTWLPAWAFDVRPPPEGADLTLDVAPGVMCTGRVLDTSLAPLTGMEVTTWAWAGGWRRVGTTRTGPGGRYSALGGAEKTRVRVVDPNGLRLTADREVPTGDGVLPDVVLPEGLPLEVTCVDEAGVPVPCELWAFSHESRTWWNAGETDAAGRLALRVSARYALRARPLEPGHIGANLFGQSHVSDTAELLCRRARPIRLLAARRDTLAPLPGVSIEAFVDAFVPVGEGVSDAAGEVTLTLPETGIVRLRARGGPPGVRVRPDWHVLDPGAASEPWMLELDTLEEIRGELRTLDGALVTEEVLVTAWNADDLTQTDSVVTSDGTFRVSVPERYHLRAEPVDPRSRLFPTQQWWNVLVPGVGHARGPIVLPRGWWADVQAISFESGAPIEGVRIEGGWPEPRTGPDGWARGILLRPVYSLRGVPPPVSSEHPTPILPDLVRTGLSIEEDRTLDSGRPLEPFRLLTEGGIVAHARVVGPRPDGTVGPLPGIEVTAFGGGRPLGTATSDSRGDVHLLALRATSERPLETTLVVEPAPAVPCLPAWKPGLRLSGTPSAPGRAEAGLIELAPAAFGHGVVRDPLGRPLSDGTVSYRCARADGPPSFVLAEGTVAPNGTFWTKLAPRTELRFWTRYRDQGWQTVTLERELRFVPGQTIDLGDVTLGEAGIVSLRCVTSAADAGGSAAPMPGLTVSIEDAVSGRVYDEGRTDGSGEVQLRAPLGRQLRLRFSYWEWAWSAVGSGFDSRRSDLFEPQFTQTFTLSAAETDFGDVRVVSPLRRSVLLYLGYVYGLPRGAFLSQAVQVALYRLGTAVGRLPAPLGVVLDPNHARTLIETAMGVMNHSTRLIRFGLRDPAAKAEAIRRANAVLDDLALLHRSWETR